MNAEVKETLRKLTYVRENRNNEKVAKYLKKVMLDVNQDNQFMYMDHKKRIKATLLSVNNGWFEYHESITTGGQRESVMIKLNDMYNKVESIIRKELRKKITKPNGISEAICNILFRN